MNHVYLIDDDLDILNNVAIFLRDEHFTVKTCASVSNFKASLPLAKPCVIVADMQMPFETGLDLQNYLIESKIDAPIIFMSGNSQPQQIISALKQGANDFLLKPIVPSELLKVLDQTFDQLKNLQQDEKIQIQTERLTEKEREVADLIKQGFSNKSIAEIMNLKADTIKKRRAQIYLKLQCSDFPEFLKRFK